MRWLALLVLAAPLSAQTPDTVRDSTARVVPVTVWDRTTRIRIFVHDTVTKVVHDTVVPPPVVTPPPVTSAAECAKPGAGWIWCDDFETDRTASYFDVEGSAKLTAGAGLNGSVGLRGHFVPGTAQTGTRFVAFGKTTGMKAVDAGTANYRELYARFWMAAPTGWTGGVGRKVSRMTSFVKSDWTQSMAAHVWQADADAQRLMLDPVSGVNGATVTTVGWNDLNGFTWMGGVTGSAVLFGPTRTWRCVEYHVRLNTAGKSDGVFESWVDGKLDAQKMGLNWVGSYAAFGLNVATLEFYDDNGSATWDRDFDNFVVSTQPIGCGAASAPPVVTPPVVTPPVDTTTPPVVTPPPPTGSTEPTPVNPFLDTRAGGAQDLQKMTDIAQFRAALSANGNPDPSGSWTLVTNYNGAGKHALRLDWKATSGEAGNTYTYYYPKSVSVVRTSLVIHQGRTATGGGFGNVGQFTAVGDADHGKKQFMWLRGRDADGNDGRTYWVWERGSGTSGNTLNIDNLNIGVGFTADHGVGVDVRWTFELTSGSPCRWRVWRNGVLVLDAKPACSTRPFAESQLSTVRWGVAQDESEYWTDLVMW